MSAVAKGHDLAVGSEIRGPVRGVTAERIQWYDSAMLSAAKGELARVGVNIHTDDDYAREQGLPAVIADGMMTTNWCSEMLLDHFGIDYIERGELRTKFIKPVFLNATVRVLGKVTAADRQSDGTVTYTLDVWCEDDEGVKLTVGDAKVGVTAR